MNPTAPANHFALALHGGAGSSPAHLNAARREEYEAALAAALRVGRDRLAAGGSSLECVEQVVRALEDDSKFNAGRGSVLNYEGEFELDAAIMDGRTRACGAVAAVRTVRNPISLARWVMTESPHVLLAGAGAEQFADAMGVERVAADYFRTPHREESWRHARADADDAAAQRERHLGTVGCVARDQAGNLAAATSTGGIVLKRFGRIGDTPLIGAGTFADNATCAVSCTGQGEEFIRHTIAADIAARLRYEGRTLAEAVEQVVHHTLRPGAGGVIAVDRAGNLALDFNTAGMYRAAADATGRWEIGLGRD